MKGPLVPPGVYQVQLTLGDQIYTQSCAGLKDPRIATSQKISTAVRPAPGHPREDLRSA